MCPCEAYGGSCNVCRGDRASGLPALDASKYRPSARVIVEALVGLAAVYLLILGVLV